MAQSIHAKEIMLGLPKNTYLSPRLLAGGKPLFTAYGCALVERNAGNSWVYHAVNLSTGRLEVLMRRAKPIDQATYERMAERISISSVRGKSRLEADRRFGEQTSRGHLHRIMETVFQEIMPMYGYKVRERQVELAGQILDAILSRRISLSEAEVGTGKTHAYLIAAILAKRGRSNDTGNVGCFGDRSYINVAHMPIVISTSSIALQRAIVKDYIPDLSDMLIKHGVIRTPLTVAVRKGKERYVCAHRLRVHIPFEHDKAQRKILDSLTLPRAPIDLDEIAGLTPHVRDKINVPSVCPENCPRTGCRYQRFLSWALTSEVDIHVCNHNYLLADTLHRAAGIRPLIPNYQCLIIDEAHKLLPTARQMYGVELSSRALPEIAKMVLRLKTYGEELRTTIRQAVNTLTEQGDKLFNDLAASIQSSDCEDEAERLTAAIGPAQARYLCNIRDIAAELAETVNTMGRRKGFYGQVYYRLRSIGATAAVLANPGSLICWQEKPGAKMVAVNRPEGIGQEVMLCAIPKDLAERLRRDMWGKNIPIILTSGTLSASGDFSHIKRTLGLRFVKRLSETSKPSPFNHEQNALLYISENVPFPDGKNTAYITALTDEIERLIRASHGHAAVLFTSYDTLGRVYAALEQRTVPYPLYRLRRGDISAIERFRKSGKGVLFASGAMWEGVDIPGDTLSMLIIAKLPFSAPDPISEYERTLYEDADEFMARVIVPEMLIKLRQGFGRLIRTEKDTGAVAILDSRIRPNGAYRTKVLAALPCIHVTNRIADIAMFMRRKKAPGYFL